MQSLIMKERQTGIDIVKAIATFLIVFIHFFMSIGYYQTPIVSNKMIVMTFLRWGGLVAVPLFAMATGYLKSKKVADKAHYMSLLPIIITYVILCTLRMIAENSVYGKIHTFKSGIKSLLSYQSAWYVGMYVALMLICPFLNRLFNSLSDKERRVFLASMIIVTMVYPVIPYVFPSYFQYMYILTYYFIGAYINEYRPDVNKLLLVALYIGSTIINGVITLINSKGGAFDPGVLSFVDNGQNAITVAVSATAVFLLFYKTDIRNGFVMGIVRSISKCSLEIYLIQAAYNAIIYTYMGRKIGSAEEYFYYIVILVPLSFVLSWITAALYKAIYGAISRLLKNAANTKHNG